MLEAYCSPLDQDPSTTDTSLPSPNGVVNGRIY